MLVCGVCYPLLAHFSGYQRFTSLLLLRCVQAPVILMILLGHFEVELDESMGGVKGMMGRQMNTFNISIDQVCREAERAGQCKLEHAYWQWRSRVCLRLVQ